MCVCGQVCLADVKIIYNKQVPNLSNSIKIWFFFKALELGIESNFPKMIVSQY